MCDVYRVIIAVCICSLAWGCENNRGPNLSEPEVDYKTDRLIQAPERKVGEFFPGTKHDPGITEPAKILGHEVGVSPATHQDILSCFAKWTKESSRAVLEPYARSHEGRDLVRVIVTSESNHGKLHEIKRNLARLADPRGLSDTDAEEIIAQTPPVAWLGFSIHGDELSGADASLAVGYHLIAGTDKKVTDLLEKVVVVIDPVMNPDGRTRALSQILETSGYVPNLDFSSMHRGRWPWGRGNHYLFDMNRDWYAGAAPETRGRLKGLLEYHPQLLVDVHEMWSLDTYLFYPPSRPHNPHRPPHVLKWQKRLADNHGAVFDSLGIPYYTREWVEGWYPGYSDAWSTMNSAVGMLYEQARYAGQSLKKPSGEIVTYDQSVHAQALSCLSNLKTLADNREAMLNDYFEGRKLPLSGGRGRVFALRPGQTPDREREFVASFLRQGVEVYIAKEEFSSGSSSGILESSAGRQTFPIGTYLISESQPQGLLVRALLDFDLRYSKSVLEKERREIERKKKSKIYDLTAWNIAQMFDLDGYWIDSPRVKQVQIRKVEAQKAQIVGSEGKKPAYAWVVDGRDDASVSFASQAISMDVKLRVADIEFQTGGKKFPRGSLLIRSGENTKDVASRLEKAAAGAGVQVHATSSGRSKDDGPDLGGQHFKLLHPPKVAVLTNSPVSTSQYGHVWHQLDTEVKISFTMIDAQRFGRYDLRRYNVLIIPPADEMIAAILKPHGEKLAAWVRGGGTLIGIGSSAAVLTGEGFNLGSVKLRRDVLLDLDHYKKAAERDMSSRDIEIDLDVLWGESRTSTEEEEEKNGEHKLWRKRDKSFVEAAKSEDEWKRLFEPKGVILRGLVNVDSWLTYGLRDELPVLMDGGFVYMVKPPAEVPVRFAPIDRLRLGGLLWPEASERIAMTAYVATERVGAGQVIYFANSPCFRAFAKGTARLLANAVVFGPSLGAKQPLVW